MGKNILIKGSNHQSSKIINRSLVLKMICTGTKLSRVDIARQTGLSKMSITNIVNGLISDGFVGEIIESQPNQSIVSSGRKPVFLDVNTDKYLALGLYISRDFATATLANLKCESILEKKCSISDDESEKSFISKIIALTGAVLDSSEAAGRKIIGIGIACIGPLDIKNGIILEPTNFHNLHGIPIKSCLEKQFGYEIFVNNDMNASVLAEKLYGKGHNTGNFIYVGVTNGIGAGIIANNILFEGDLGFAGEIGHTTINCEGPICACGNSGCLELYASIPEIIKQAEKQLLAGEPSSLGNIEKIQWTDIIDHALKGDSFTLGIIDLLCKYMTYGLTSLINTFDPNKIFLGHDIALAGELVASRLENSIQDRIFSKSYKRIPIEISAFSDKAPIAGSAAIILDKLFQGYEFRGL